MDSRLNFDNPGLQTGLDIGSIAADFELQMIVNRKKVFEAAVKTDDFKANVYNQLTRYREASQDAVTKAFKDFRETVSANFTDTYTRGVSGVDASVKRFSAAGIKLQTPQPRDRTALLTYTAMTLGGLLSALMQAQSKAQDQLLQITSLMPPEGDVRQNLDSIQAAFLQQGLTVDGVGGAKRLTAYAEFTERNQSQKLLLSARGERAADYGIAYALISGHPSSCPLCTPWQEKIVINDVFADGRPDGKTPLMSEAVNDGLYHFNCRHSYVVYIPGFDKAGLYKKDIPSREETAKRYAIEQQQRHNERNIREWKLREAAAMTDKERMTAERKIEEWQAQQRALREVAKDNKVPFYRQYSREQIGGDTKPTIKPEVLEYWGRSGKEVPQKAITIDDKELKEFYNKATANEHRITADLKEIAKESGTKLGGLEYKTKEVISTKRKIGLIMKIENVTQKEAENRLHDVIRYTVIADNDKLSRDYGVIFDKMAAKGYTLVEKKNTWLSDSAYKGVNCKVIDSTGQKFELQFHTQESFAVKQKCHTLYEAYRGLDPNSQEAREIDRKMRQLSNSLVPPVDIEKI